MIQRHSASKATMSFEDKVVLVTGAASGIGEAIAKLFAKEGAYFVAVDRNEESLRKTAEFCEKNGKKPLQIAADLTNENDTKRVVEETINKHKKLDVLINCAGILKTGVILDGTILQPFDEVIGINLRAIIHLTTLAAPYLVKTKGNIVNISSNSGSVNSPPYLGYCMSKSGVTHFTKGAALELGPSGVRVNAVCPGIVRTKIFGDLSFDYEEYKKQTALGKISEPEEIADLVSYLASDKAKSITGAAYVIDNGFLLKGST